MTSFGNWFGSTIPAQKPAAQQEQTTIGNSFPSYSGPDWLNKLGQITLPQAGPGQLQMLASQLAQGGFGNPQANYQWLDNAYDPVVAPDWYQGDDKKPDDKPTTKTPAPLNYYMTSGDRQVPWWKTSAVNDRRYIEEFGNVRSPYPPGDPRRK